MNDQTNTGQPFNGGLPQAGEPAPAPKPWRPELAGIQGGAAAPAQPPRPWRPEFQSIQPAIPAIDQNADVVLAEVGEALSDEQDLAVVAGAPGKLRASLSKANLVLFGLFLAGVGVVAFMSLKKGPQSVNAADQQAEQKVDTAIDKFLAAHAAEKAAPAKSPEMPAPGSPNARKLITDTRRLVDLFLNFTSKKQVPLENLRINPFKFDATAEAVQNNPKTLADKKAEEAARLKRIEQAKAMVKKLQLQTVISGPAGRQAMVNGAILKVGEKIEMFAVTDIQDRSVTLAYEGLTFTLEMGY